MDASDIRTYIIMNCGYVLCFAGFFIRDILWLRDGVTCGQTLVSCAGFIMGNPFGFFWNGVFAGLNAVWVARIIRERRPLKIPEAVRDLYDNVFTALTPREFLDFWAMGRTIECGAGTLIRDGERPEDVYLVLDGAAQVGKAGKTLATLPRGRFLGEMSFLTDRPASADIRGDGALKTMVWSQDLLRKIKATKPALFMKIQGALGCDLAIKIHDANEAAAQSVPN